ncbi:hypothetical protein WIS52_20490 [Pseudonocardia nematodicida]|uniref:Uncharacterized protein n=1 Tax=Pseudonocardia nematodicida TaxID=1206997 RepID=A0ABV1KG40_9PSEU
MSAPSSIDQTSDPLVAQLARILDPVAFDDRAEARTLGQLWDQTCRRMTAEQHARRAIAAGWSPSETR